MGRGLVQKDAATPWYTPAAVNDALTGHVVLVVEDDYFIAEEICAVLRRKGATITGPAVDLDEARRLIANELPDCAILDVNLHGEVVFQLASELRARGVQTIFTTGYDAAYLPTAFRDAIYFQKPIDLAALARAVRQCPRRWVD